MTGKAREVIQKVEYEHLQNCSFKPTITQRPEGSNHGSNQKVTAEQRMAKLTEPKTVKQKERD